MDLTTLCTVVAALRVSPDRSQFFHHERLSLSCEWRGNSSGWTVMRNTSRHTNQPCLNAKRGREGSYSLDAVYHTDSGVYWCQSAAGQCSRAVHINVSEGPLILESPALPVEEGGEVTLRCRAKTPASSGPFVFCRDGVPIERNSTGNLSIHSISRADAGVYKCQAAAGESPESQLSVRARGSAPSPEPSCCKQRRDPPDPGLLRLLLPVGVVGGVALLVVLSVGCIRSNRKGLGASLLSRWCSRPDEADDDVSYTVVTVSQNLRPRGVTDAEETETFYSTVKPGAQSA